MTVPPWNQGHADAANSGQTLTGTTPARDNGVMSAEIGRVEFSSPVVAPDGTVYIGTYSPTAGASSLVRMSTASAITVIQKMPLSGQISTPAVDASGNVYITQRMDADSAAYLLSYGPSGNTRWYIRLGRTVSLAQPKVMAAGTGSLVFVAFTGGQPSGSHVFITNEQGIKPKDVLACLVIQGGYGPPGFHIEGFELGPPFFEGPPVGIRTIDGERGLETFLVVASPRCGVTFFRFSPPSSSATLPTLVNIKTLDDDDAPFSYSAPAISADGMAVISDWNQRVTAYDVRTGDEKWHHDLAGFVIGTPAFLPLAINFVYVASSNKLTKFDVATGQIEAEIDLTSPGLTSPAVGGQNIFINTKAGVFTYDLDLKLLAFSALPGGSSSPAIDSPSGKIYVAGTNSRFYVFAGP